MYKGFFKRFLDVWVATLGLIASSPLLLLTILVLYLSNNGQIFKLLKFKTMTDERDGFGNLLPDKDRFTRIGSIIRAASIDELPQLINVILGEMSLIGPRPLMPHLLPLYTPEQARRHEVRPGITGWAQVHGRSKMKFSKKFEYDVYYVDNISIWLDVRIFFKTIKNVFLRENVGRGAEEMNDVDDLGFAKRLEKISDSI